MAHRLLIGKGMITLNLKRIFLVLTLLPLFAVAADDCALSDPTLTVQAYTVNPQTERVKMYWQKANGEAWGTLHALLADMNSQGQVQMAMNGGIYDESYAPLGLYIENGQQKVALNLASGEGNFFIRPGGVFYVAGDKVGIVRLDAFKTSKEIQFAVQSGPMLMENGVINPRIHPNVASRKIRNGVGINKQGNAVFLLSQQATNFYDFACYAKAKLNVEQLLYLDGTISHMYMKGGAIPWQRYPFVTMISVEWKGKHCTLEEARQTGTGYTAGKSSDK